MKSEVKIEKKEVEITKKGVLGFFILYSIIIFIYYFKIFRFRINYSNETFLKFIAPIFIYYYLKFTYICSKEKIVIKEEEITLIRKFLFITFLKQEIKIKDIQMIMYRKNHLPYLVEVIFLPFSFKNLYNIAFQVEENRKIKHFFYGSNISKEDYNLIKNEIKKLSKKILIN